VASDLWLVASAKIQFPSLTTNHKSLNTVILLQQDQPRPRHVLRHGEAEFRHVRLLQRTDDVDAHGLHGGPRTEGVAAVALGFHHDADLAEPAAAPDEPRGESPAGSKQSRSPRFTSSWRTRAGSKTALVRPLISCEGGRSTAQASPCHNGQAWFGTPQPMEDRAGT